MRAPVKIARFLAACFGALILCAQPATAQTYTKTYTQVSSLSLSGAPTAGPVAAPGPSFLSSAGWSDQDGNSWQTYSYGRTDEVSKSSRASPWNTDVLVRQETALNQRIEVSSDWYDNGVSNYQILRYRKTTNGANGYIVGLSGAHTPAIYKTVDGTLTQLWTGSSVSFSSGATYTVRGTVEQTNSTTTSIFIELLNSGGSQVSTQTITDTDTSLQNAVGVAAVFQTASSADSHPISLLTTYSGDGSASATSYSLSGPSSVIVGQASSAFTVSDNGQTASAVTITPSDGGAGGSFTPSTAVFPAGSQSSQSFTYTAASAGSKTISTTNGGSLTNPASLTVTALSLTTVAVSSTSFHYSPLNWSGDTGRGGSVWRSTWNPGAYLEMQFTTSSVASPTANMIFSSNGSTSAKVHFYLNGSLVDAYVTASGSVALGSYLQPNTAYRLLMVLNRSTQAQRWNYNINAVRVMGFQVDTADVFTSIPYGSWGELVGDSITEGVGAAGDGSGATDNVYDYSFEVGQALRAQGYDYAVSANGGSGFLETGDSGADIPAYYAVSGGTYSEAASRWDKVDQGVSTFDSAGHTSGWGATGQDPAFILVNYNYNEALQSASLTDLNTSIQGWLAAQRAAAPSAQIVMLVPPGLRAYQSGGKVAYANLVGTATAAYLAAHTTDTRTSVVDLGATLSANLNSQGYVNTDGIHPNTLGHAMIAPRVLAAINAAIAPAAATTTASSPHFHPGFH